MKYFILIALMGLGSSMAFAADGTEEGRDNNKRVDVRFDCHFRSRVKAGVACQADGEVCIDREGRLGGRSENGRCERGSLRNRIQVSCNDGYHDEARAYAFLRRDEGDRRTREELVIQAELAGNRGDWGRDGQDRIRLFDVGIGERFSTVADDRGDHFQDEFDAVLTRDTPWPNGGDGLAFWGRCFARFEKREEQRREDPRPAPAPAPAPTQPRP